MCVCVFVRCAVEGGHRAVVWDRFSGVKDQVYNEGTHFRVPFLQVTHAVLFVLVQFGGGGGGGGRSVPALLYSTD